MIYIKCLLLLIIYYNFELRLVFQCTKVVLGDYLSLIFAHSVLQSTVSIGLGV